MAGEGERRGGIQEGEKKRKRERGGRGREGSTSVHR